MKNKLCNSVHTFLNLKFFNKYGTILLVLILVVIIASLMDFNLGTVLPKKMLPSEELGLKNNEEGFTTIYKFPDLFYLKRDIQSTMDNKYVYIRQNTQYNDARLLTPEMKKSPYRVFEKDGHKVIRIPIFIREFLNILDKNSLTLTDDERRTLTTNEYIELQIDDLKEEGSNSTKTDIDKNTSFTLKLLSPSVEQGDQYLILNDDNTISFRSSTQTITTGSGGGSGGGTNDNIMNRQGRFMLKLRSEIENEIFNPIVPGTLKMQVHPDKNELDVNFNVDPNQEDIDHFLIILAKYDYKRNLLGHLKVHTSVEGSESKKNICMMDKGIKKCTYTLTDIDHIDENGHVLYYRLGVIPINKIGNSGRYMEPNYPGGHTHFVMSKSEKEMDKIIRKIQEMEKSETQREKLNEQIVSNAGGEYEFLKKQLGNYPSGLILDTNHNTLKELVNKSMALGEINLDISNV